jgi:hypothetical protein
MVCVARPRSGFAHVALRHMEDYGGARLSEASQSDLLGQDVAEFKGELASHAIGDDAARCLLCPGRAARSSRAPLRHRSSVSSNCKLTRTAVGRLSRGKRARQARDFLVRGIQKMAAQSKHPGELMRSAQLKRYKEPTAARSPIDSAVIRSLQLQFQVDGGEEYIEDVSWRPFTNLTKRRSPIPPAPISSRRPIGSARDGESDGSRLSRSSLHDEDKDSSGRGRRRGDGK